MSSPTRAAQLLPNLLQSLDLILGDHTPLKNRGFLCFFLPFTRAARASDFAARRAAARRSRDRSRVPNRLGAPLAVRRPQTTAAAPILTTTKPGRRPPQEIAARRRARPSKAAAESDFDSTRGESRQFLPHGWIEDRRWYPLSRVPDCLDAPPAARLLSDHRRRTNLDEDEAGTTSATSNRRSTLCTPVQSRRRVRFCFYPG